jgi:hypothetical protein
MIITIHISKDAAIFRQKEPIKALLQILQANLYSNKSVLTRQSTFVCLIRPQAGPKPSFCRFRGVDGTFKFVF